MISFSLHVSALFALEIAIKGLLERLFENSNSTSLSQPILLDFFGECIA